MKQILDKLDFDYNTSSFISTRCGGSRFETSRIASNSVNNSPKRASQSPVGYLINRTDQRKHQTLLLDTQRSSSYEPHTQRQFKDSENIKIQDEAAFELKPVQVQVNQPRHHSVLSKTVQCKKHPPAVYIPNNYTKLVDVSEFSPLDSAAKEAQVGELPPPSIRIREKSKQENRFQINKMFPAGDEDLYPKMFDASRNIKELENVQTGPTNKGTLTVDSDYVPAAEKSAGNQKISKTSYKQYRRSSIGENDNAKVLNRIKTREKNMSIAYGMPIVSSGKMASPDSQQQTSMTKQV